MVNKYKETGDPKIAEKIFKFKDPARKIDISNWIKKIIRGQLAQVDFTIFEEKDFISDNYIILMRRTKNNFKFDEYGDYDSYLKYLEKTVRLSVKDEIRKYRKQSKLINKIEEQLIVEKPFTQQKYNPENVYLKNERNEIILIAIDNLASNEKKVILVHFFKEKPIKDLARELGYSKRNIYKIKNKALKKLKPLLSPYFEEYM
ncbi:MAG: sigma-70 family RNA polymerase sigma factor [Candidatus Woesearchaeota archaeon]